MIVPRRVLIVRLSALGDQILAAPVVDDLRRRFPGCRVDWAVDERFVAVVQRIEGVTRVHALPLRRAKGAGFPVGGRLLWSAVRSMREERYDAVLDLQGLWKSALVARAARLSTRGERIGFAAGNCGEPGAARLYHRPVAVVDDRPDAPERARALVAAALGTDPWSLPRYGLQTLRRPRADAPVLLVHGASREGKRWAEPNWVAVGRALAAHGHRLALPWGDEDERARAERVARAIGTDRCEVASRRRSIEHWLQRVGEAPLVVGVDTGITHFASAMATPVVALFSDTPPWQLRPQQPGLARTVGDLGRPASVEAVIAAARELLGTARAVVAPAA